MSRDIYIYRVVYLMHRDVYIDATFDHSRHTTKFTDLERHVLVCNCSLFK